jgi:hypothetical protein
VLEQKRQPLRQRDWGPETVLIHTTSIAAHVIICYTDVQYS